MIDPCQICKYYKQTQRNGRCFSGCSNEEMEKGFEYDSYFYHHSCSNLDIREECVNCAYNSGRNCTCVYAYKTDEKGNCLNKRSIEDCFGRKRHRSNFRPT